MQAKPDIAVQIALQTHVLRICATHEELYCDDDVDPSAAFALAVKLVKDAAGCVADFEGDAHALTDLLSETIGAAPAVCPLCDGERGLSAPQLRATAAAASRVCSSLSIS